MTRTTNEMVVKCSHCDSQFALYTKSRAKFIDAMFRAGWSCNGQSGTYVCQDCKELLEVASEDMNLDQ